jgi:hypothetical protein
MPGACTWSVEPVDTELARQKESFWQTDDLSIVRAVADLAQCRSNRCGSASRWNKLHALRVLRRYNSSTL